MLVYLNGDYTPRDQARVPIDDRGFLFGDGVYEVIRVYDGTLFLPDEHMVRLQQGMDGLEIRSEGLDSASLLAIADRLLTENGMREGEATVYIQVTRGVAPRTHHFPNPPCSPTIYISTARFTPPGSVAEEGASGITHPDIRWARCDLKTVNLLPNCMAKQRAVEAGAFEAILIRDGVVTEGSHSNVFAVVNGELRTYPKSNYILPGITRDLIIALAAERNIPVREQPILYQEIGKVEELFVTGTTTDVTPIVRLDGRPVGAGRPGPVATELRKALQARIRGQVPASV